VTAPATSADSAYAGLDPDDVAVSNADNEPPDLIFKDGFETGSFSAWSGSATGGGRLTVDAPSALEGSFGMSAAVTDTTALYVQDSAPTAETRYRVRFLLDPNGIGPVAPATSSTIVVFAAYQTTTALPVVVVLRKTGGQYAVQAYTRLDSGALSATPAVNVTDAPHAIAFAWQRASGAGANNGGFLLAIDGATIGSLTGLDNDTGAIEAVRLGVLGLTQGTAGTLYFDSFESRR
ncbi:MAG TPA: hypothetical protein VMV21_12160, partial [Vicinamibacteria bacterium]|nr:hypothetical protein [Vicinamibacteria bacterium]